MTARIVNVFQRPEHQTQYQIERITQVNKVATDDHD